MKHRQVAFTGLSLALLALIALGMLVIAPSGFCLDWATIPGGRVAPLSVPTAGKTGFTILSPEQTGILFTNSLRDDRQLTNQVLLNGSGVAAGDVDGDGLCDLYFCGLDGNNALYKNLGNWKFQDITATAGVAGANWDASGAVFADANGDGTLDLIVSTLIHGTHIFLNDGKGHFTESEKNAGLNAANAGTSLALADIDGDGNLDLYIANYRYIAFRDQPNTPIVIGIENGKPVVKTIGGRPISDPDLTNRFNFRFMMSETGGTMAFDENGQQHLVCLNDGKGHFTPVSWTDGRFLDEDGKPLTHAPFDWGLSVAFRDINGDGAPDIYVCNDFKSPDRIWLNDGKGHFRALPALAIRQSCFSSMGVDFADIDRDGHDDIFVMDMLSRDHRRRFTQRLDIRPEAIPFGVIDSRPQYGRNMLYLNRGDGTYAEIARFCGLEAAEWAWMPVFLDVDLDGFEDILIPNGFARDNMNIDIVQNIEKAKKEKRLSNVEMLRLRKMFPILDTPNLAFHNLGNLQFEEVGAQWGFNATTISQGMALADLDNDGDLDLVVNNLNGVAAIYRNNTIAPRVSVRLKGMGGNTRGIGGRIKVTGGPVPQSQEIMAGGRYLSADDPQRVFAAPGTNHLNIEVLWRSGRRSFMENVSPNMACEVDESSASLAGPQPKPQPAAPWFRDVSTLLGHTHYEEPFDDFARQPLLSRRSSQPGPGVAWSDLNGDGWEDLIIGSGRGGTMAVFRNDGQGKFQLQTNAPYSELMGRDQTGLLVARKSEGASCIYAGSSNYEDGETNGGGALSFDLARKQIDEAFPGQESSTGPMAMADMDGDGQLELFVGGQVIPARYPEPASSLMFRMQGGKWVVDAENTRILAKVGLVNGAVFSDLDGDGAPELILTCYWGPIRIFKNDRGRLKPWDWPVKLPMLSRPVQPLPATLADMKGWWNGVTTGDFDGDGRMDIGVANWGRNTKWESFRAKPLRLYYGDVDDNGVLDVIESVWDADMKNWVPFQQFHLIGSAIPSLREEVGTFDAYARASLTNLYGERLKKTTMLEANWLESTVFLNRGDHFEVRVLPNVAQFTPAFAVCAGDLDGDGFEDLLLSQNFFGAAVDSSRQDAGRGLVLKGDGHGEFKAVAGQDSGILVYGEQRGAALCDYDRDGRWDTVITQNAGETKLYRNDKAIPGLLVHLSGPPGNPQGIGAVIRRGQNEKWGPAREIHAGSGYLSQESAVQVLTGQGRQLSVRWPWGKSVIADVPAEAKEVVVDLEGKVKIIK